MKDASTAGSTKGAPALPMNIEDYGDFLGAVIVPGMRFRIESACAEFEDAQFCGLVAEETAGGLAYIGMRFRINGDTTLSFRWAEMDRITHIE